MKGVEDMEEFENMLKKPKKLKQLQVIGVDPRSLWIKHIGSFSSPDALYAVYMRNMKPTIGMTDPRAHTIIGQAQIEFDNLEQYYKMKEFVKENKMHPKLLAGGIYVHPYAYGAFR